jgi:preprotein translocase subunit SecD
MLFQFDLFQEEKIDTVSNINNIGEVVSATSFQKEIVLSDEINSESGVSSHDSRIDEDCLASLEVVKVDDDDMVSEIVEEKEDCSSKAILINSKDKQDFNSKNEEHAEANTTDTEVGNDVVTIENEITCDENGNLDMKVNDEDQPILVSNSFQLTTLLMLLPGFLLLLVLLLLMLLTQKFSFLQ